MTRSITTLVLIGISALIILYILSSFHKVFNRETIHEQTPIAESEVLELTNATPSPQASGTEQEVNEDEQLINADKTTTITDTSSSDNAEAEEPTLNELVSESEAQQSESENNIVSSPGEILREKPHLQNALPPIPQAPPRPQGPPVVTSPVEESFSQTGSGNQGSFPSPITTPSTGTSSASGSAFPAPITSGNSTIPSNAQGSSSFPAPR